MRIETVVINADAVGCCISICMCMGVVGDGELTDLCPAFFPRIDSRRQFPFVLVFTLVL